MKKQFLIILLFFTLPIQAQEAEIEYEINNFHDTIIAAYELEMEQQEKDYLAFLKRKLESSLLDMNDYYGYSISKLEELSQNEEDEKMNEMLAFLVLAGIILLIFFIPYFKLRKINKAWNNGLFPKKFEFSDDNLMEAYLRLAAMLMRYDQNNIKGKIAYAHIYFAKHFPNSNIDFTYILREAYKRPIKLENAAKWIKKHLPKHERIQVLYFLAGLAVVDGDFNRSEKSIITKFSELLDLSKKELDSILNMYVGYEKQNRQQEKKSRPTISRRKSEIERCSKILGVSSQAGMDELKKAYRQLVKLHHPDRFATASKAQQEIAKGRFIKIQLAYEYLESNK